MPLPAPTLVMLPGLDGTASLFASALALDWAGLPATAIRLPATGPQDYSSLVQVVDPLLPPGPLVLLAESFSTPLAMRLAARHASRVRALILVAGFCASPQSPGLGWLPLRPLFAVTPPAFFIRQFLTGDDAPADLPNAVAQAIATTPAATLAERVRVALALTEDDCPVLRQLPILLLQAQRDQIVPWDAQSQLERHFPEARTTWIDGPHLLMQTRTSACHQAVTTFLRGLA